MVGIGSRHGREETDTKCGSENIKESGCLEDVSVYGIMLTCTSYYIHTHTHTHSLSLSLSLSLCKQGWTLLNQPRIYELSLNHAVSSRKIT